MIRKNANEMPDDAKAIGRSGMSDDEWLAHVRKRYDIHTAFWSSIHNQARDDDRFVAGYQWSSRLKQKRKREDRPCLTYNLLPAFSRQIVNKARQNRPQIKAVAVEVDVGDTKMMSNTAGRQDYSFADVYSGIIKNIENTSRADQAYDTAIKHAVDHGFGYFYLMPVWSEHDPFVQDLRIFRVKDSYSATLDPGAEEADYRDAGDGFMEARITREAFEKKYPDVEPEDFAPSGLTARRYDDWYQSEDLRVAQYFWIEYTDDEVLRLVGGKYDGKTVYLSDVKDTLDEMYEKGEGYIERDHNGEEMRRKVKRRRCMWMKMIATAILEGPKELPFSSVPIFPVMGDEMIVEGRTHYEGAFRHSKDPQRSYNYWRTAAAETVALAPRAPWKLTAKQMQGHEHFYESSNNSNLPYVLYNHDEKAPPPSREFPNGVPAAELANANQDAADLQTIIGLHDASLGRESNEKSGKAIVARQNQGSTATFQFPDNLERAQQQCGRLIVEAIPRIYDTKRVMRIRTLDNKDDYVQINVEEIDEETGEKHLVHDIAYGKYDVVMDTASYYATQEQEAAAMQLEFMGALPPDKAANIAHLIGKNLNVPGMDEVTRVLRRMLPDELKSEDEKIADLPKGVTMDENGQMIKDGEQWQPPPTIQQQLQAQEQKLREIESKAEEGKAGAVRAKAESDEAIAGHRVREHELRVEMQAIKKEMEENKNTAIPAEADNLESNIQELFATQSENIEEQVAATIAESIKRVKQYIDKVEARIDSLQEQQTNIGNQSPSETQGELS